MKYRIRRACAPPLTPSPHCWDTTNRTERGRCDNVIEIMDDARRYQQDFDLLMQEVEADATLRQNKTRDMIRKKLEKSMNRLADAHGWTIEQREAHKERLLVRVFSDLESSN